MISRIINTLNPFRKWREREEKLKKVLQKLQDLEQIKHLWSAPTTKHINDIVKKIKDFQQYQNERISDGKKLLFFFLLAIIGFSIMFIGMPDFGAILYASSSSTCIYYSIKLHVIPTKFNGMMECIDTFCEKINNMEEFINKQRKLSDEERFNYVKRIKKKNNTTFLNNINSNDKIDDVQSIATLQSNDEQEVGDVQNVEDDKYNKFQSSILNLWLSSGCGKNIYPSYEITMQARKERLERLEARKNNLTV